MADEYQRKSVIGNCVALYDWIGDVDSKQWLQIVLDFFELCHAEPDTCVIEADSKKSGLLKLKAFQRRVEKSQPREIESIELFSTVANYKQLVFGWRVSAAFNKGHLGPYSFIAWDDGLLQFHDSSIRDLLKRWSALGELVYGIAYQRLFEKGPDLYALGMAANIGASDEERKEAKRINAWMLEIGEDGRKRHLVGMFRDIYPINILSERHLGKKVDGIPVKDWIAKMPDRGILEPIASSSWIWRVPNSAIPAVRKAFAESGLLICV